jgi:hypothetical protein
MNITNACQNKMRNIPNGLSVVLKTRKEESPVNILYNISTKKSRTKHCRLVVSEVQAALGNILFNLENFQLTFEGWNERGSWLNYFLIFLCCHLTVKNRFYLTNFHFFGQVAVQ